MSTDFGHIIGAKPPRQAEMTDTRQEIRRHDPEFEQNKRKKKDRDNQIGFDEDDNAVVSVEALRLFLQNFLKSTAASAEEPAADATNNLPPQTQGQGSLFTEADLPTQQKHRSGKAEKAASAYKHSAETSPGNTYSTIDARKTETVAQSLGLGGGEIRLIHSVLEDLKHLSERNVQYLRIERSDSFLHSLANAIAKIKN